MSGSEPYGDAELHLLSADPVLGAFIRDHGPCELRLRRYEGELFEVLANAIIAQQISTRAADSIRARFVAEFGSDGGYPPTRRLAQATAEELRSVGLSRQKAEYLTALASAIEAGHPTIADLASLSDEEVIRTLVELRGIGRWTAEMLLIFRLGRPDVFPADDLGVRNGMMRLYGLPAPPKPARMKEIAAPWSPFRSTGAWYMWRALGWSPPPDG